MDDMNKQRHTNSYHIIMMKAFQLLALRSLSSHCLLPLCCAARTPRTPHAALALLLLVPRTHRATKPRHQTTTTNDDEKMLRTHTGTKPKTPIDGASENWGVAPATGPRCARGWLPSSSHASVA